MEQHVRVTEPRKSLPLDRCREIRSAPPQPRSVVVGEPLQVFLVEFASVSDHEDEVQHARIDPHLVSRKALGKDPRSVAEAMHNMVAGKLRNDFFFHGALGSQLPINVVVDVGVGIGIGTNINIGINVGVAVVFICCVVIDIDIDITITIVVGRWTVVTESFLDGAGLARFSRARHLPMGVWKICPCRMPVGQTDTANTPCHF
mmetsp:Transcript_21810/g.51737  ORF Transcript_21810/g.51737 Transcript_21810/m.51737 type:complete len:203 (+) Transcript_21810:551-1159(+)